MGSYEEGSNKVQTNLLNRIVCGDCLEVMAQIPDGSVHLVVTSPPYNLEITYDTYEDNLAYEKYLDWMNKVWEETKRVLAKGGRFALNIAPTSIKNFRPIHHDFANQLRDLGMIYRTEVLWYKQTMRKRTAWGSWKSPSNPHIVPSWEYVLVFSKDQWELPGRPEDIDITSEEFMRFSDGFWYIPPEPQRRGHPAPFPEELIYRLIKFYTYKGNIVLDMFGGTGTVAVVAYKTGRHFIHLDVSKNYCEIAERRLELARLAAEMELNASRVGKQIKYSELRKRALAPETSSKPRVTITKTTQRTQERLLESTTQYTEASLGDVNPS